MTQTDLKAAWNETMEALLRGKFRVSDKLVVIGVNFDAAFNHFKAALNHRPSPPDVVEAVILRGVGKINGDGWKDTTQEGEVIFVWNEAMPEPYSPGQYPRVGCEGWTASVEQYDFSPASVADLSAIRHALASAKQESVDRTGLGDAKFHMQAALNAAGQSPDEHLFDVVEQLNSAILCATLSPSEAQTEGSGQ